MSLDDAWLPPYFPPGHKAHPKFRNEAELARVVSYYLEANRHTVFHEIAASYGIPCDIASMYSESGGKIVTIVECKMSITFGLIEQAIERTRWGNYVYVAIPWYRRNAMRKYQRTLNTLQRAHGFGVMSVWPDQEKGLGVRITRQSKFCPDAATEHILDLMESGAPCRGEAGSPSPKQLTHFRVTMHRIAEFVRANPGMDLYTVIDRIDHHYATKNSAYQALRKHFEGPGHDELTARRFDGARGGLRLFPKGAAGGFEI